VPAIFQGTMYRILRRYLGKFVLVYLDDILVFSKNQEDSGGEVTYICF
jgi:hypothetical protein